MNNIIKLVYINKKFYIYINNRIFFTQIILKSNNKFFSNRVYTWFYVLKIMYRFGLVAQISKKWGY